MRESRVEQEGGSYWGDLTPLSLLLDFDSLENVYNLANIEGAFEKVGFFLQKIVKVFQSKHSFFKTLTAVLAVCLLLVF